MCVFVCVCARVFVCHACVAAFLSGTHLRARVFNVSVFVCVHMCVCVCLPCAWSVGIPAARRGPAVFIAQLAARGPPHVRLSALVIDRSPIAAAGVTWTSRTLAAPWAARAYHTSVIDAISGAIYVIGGYDRDVTRYNDVWVSANGGADPALGLLARDWVKGYGGVLAGYSRGTCGALSIYSERHSGGYSRGTLGYLGVYTHVRSRLLSGNARRSSARLACVFVLVRETACVFVCVRARGPQPFVRFCAYVLAAASVVLLVRLHLFSCASIVCVGAHLCECTRVCERPYVCV